MKKIYKFISVFLSVSFVFLMSSCTNNGKIKPVSAEIDDSVTIKLPVSASDTLNPYTTLNSFNRDLRFLLFEGLTKSKSDFSTENVIAESVKVAGTLVQVEINRDYCFSDGSEITADDIEYSYELAKKSDVFGKQLNNFKEISSSGFSVSFELEKEDKYAAACLDFPIIKNESDKDGNTIIGSGKYKIEDSQTLIMNERWHNDTMPKVRRIKLVNLLDASTALQSVESGAISYYFDSLGNGSFVRTATLNNDISMLNLVFLGINSSNENLKNQQVRQAISLLIPKEKIVEESFLGYAEIAETPFHPQWKEIKNIHIEQTDAEIKKDEAKLLLENAGLSRKSDIGSSIMSLKLVVNKDNPFKVSTAEKIASVLGENGIRVEVKKLSFERFKEAVSLGNFDLYVGETVISPNMSLSQFFTSGSGVSNGIDTTSRIVSMYDEFLRGKITVQRFVDYFNVSSPFVPVCYRKGIEVYTNELSVGKYGSPGDRYENIYSWYY